MTYPVTPNPNIHNNSDTTSAAVQQAQNTYQQLNQLLSGFPAQIVGNLVNSILTSLGIEPVIGDVETMLSQLETSLTDAWDGAAEGFTNLAQGIVSGLQGVWNDAISDVTNVVDSLGTIPGLNIVGGVRPSVTTLVPSGHVGINSNAELLLNPGFDTPQALASPYDFNVTWDANEGRTNLGSIKFSPDGEYCYSYISNPIPVNPGDIVVFSIWAKWASLTTISGKAPIRLELLWYNKGVRIDSLMVDQFVSPPTNQASWSQLGNDQYQLPPYPIDTVYLRALVDVTATGGTVWFDDASATKPSTMNLSGIPAVPATQVQGVQGIATMNDSIQSLWDAIVSAVDGTPSTGNSLSTTSLALQGAVQTINDTAAQALASTNTLSIQYNQAVAQGLEQTVESNFDLGLLGAGATPTNFTFSQTGSAGGVIRIGQSATKGFVQWFGQVASTPTHFYLNFYKMDSSGNFNLLFTSSDIHSSLATSWNWQLYDFPGPAEFPVVPGDIIGVELQTVGGSYQTAGLQPLWLANHPVANTKNLGFSQNWGTGNATSQILSASIGWTTSVPYVGLGVSNLPVNYQPPEITSYETAGTYAYNIPSWIQAGDFLDIIAIGAGGGGQSSLLFFVFGEGGYPGSWEIATIESGTDYLSSETTLAITVGAGGSGGSGGSNGTSGANSTVGYTDTSHNPQTIVAAGGGTNNGTSNGFGPSPDTQTYESITYFAGTEVLPGFVGSSPGGGGGGGPSFSSGSPGAAGAVWVVARQAT